MTESEKAADGHVHTVKWTQTPRDVKIQSMRKTASGKEKTESKNQ